MSNEKGVFGGSASLISALVGYAVFKAIPVDVTMGLFMGALAGGLVGLIPFLIAKKRGLCKLATVAIWTCLGCGLVLGLLLAVPACIVFSVIALVKKQPQESVVRAATGGVAPPPLGEPASASHTNTIPGTIEEDGFSLSLPNGWTEDSKSTSGPVQWYSYVGSGRVAFFIMVSLKSSGSSADYLVGAQREALFEKIPEQPTTDITRWSRYTGKGIQVEGSLVGKPASITIFGMESGDRVGLIMETIYHGPSEQTLAGELEQIRQSFKLNSEAKTETCSVGSGALSGVTQTVEIPMPDLKFSCPNCNQHLEAAPEMIGSVVACPSCNKQIQVPQTAPISLPPPPMNTEKHGSRLTEASPPS